MAETYDADQKISSDYGIEIRGAAMPITVAWNISEPSAHTSLRGADGNAIAQMKSSTGAGY